jgi:adenine-specific DNA-methyltransferase
VRVDPVTSTTHRARQLRQSPPDAERAMWQALRDRQILGHKFRRQHPVGRYFADFACIEAMLIVELDGGQHFSDEGMAADARRTAELNQLGYHVLRFTDREVLVEREAVRLSIFNWLEANVPRPNSDPHPSPLPQAGEGEKASCDPHPSPLPQAGEGAKRARGAHRHSSPLPLGEGQGEGQPDAAAPSPRLNSDPHPSPLPRAGEGVKSDPSPLPRAGEGATANKD